MKAQIALHGLSAEGVESGARCGWRQCSQAVALGRSSRPMRTRILAQILTDLRAFMRSPSIQAARAAKKKRKFATRLAADFEAARGYWEYATTASEKAQLWMIQIQRMIEHGEAQVLRGPDPDDLLAHLVDEAPGPFELAAALDEPPLPEPEPLALSDYESAVRGLRPLFFRKDGRGATVSASQYLVDALAAAYVDGAPFASGKSIRQVADEAGLPFASVQRRTAEWTARSRSGNAQ